jgi:hypothetical protein
MISARALGVDVAGITINRYCASGLESIAMATAKIRSGMADCIIAGGTESMSLVPTAGWKTVPSYEIAKNDPDYYLSMGLTLLRPLPKNIIFQERIKMHLLLHRIKKQWLRNKKIILSQVFYPSR